VTERAIVDAIMRCLKRRGAWAFKTHGTVAGRAGIPDIVGAYRAWPIAIEAKQHGNYPTRLQRHELERARRAGAIAIVAHDVHAVEAMLDAIDELDGVTPPDIQGTAA
jgi:Holliday junction resolvase